MAERIGDDQVLSLQEVIEEEENLEATANAVLGPGDDQNCTYPNGYMQRQALYACGTCSESSGKEAGVCLACSLTCHEGHELYELYTKRNFQCDCGNEKFPKDFKCQLFPDKSPSNEENQYNHNFRGVYCTCCRPYPDPDDDEEDDMIQCSVCEDWYHSRHLGNLPPSEFEEMVCDACMQKNSFLRVYEASAQIQVEVDVETVDTEKQAEKGKEEEEKSPEEEVGENKTKEKCVLKDRVSSSVWNSSGAAYFLQEWRNSLCRCSYCMALYSASKVEFLLDVSDTVGAYEAQSSATKCSSSLQSGMEAFRKNLDHVQQVEALHHYSELSSELTDYLKSFAENNKVVKREDIEEFFESMSRKKRRKIEEGLEGVPPAHCHF